MADIVMTLSYLNILKIVLQCLTGIHFFRYYSQLLLVSNVWSSCESEGNELLLTALLSSYLQSLTQTINSTIYMDLFKMPDMTMSRHVFLTALNCSISLGICLITQDLGQVFNVIGSYTATMLGYIFPGFLYIGAYKNAFWDIINTWDKLSLWGKIFSLKSFYIPVLLIPYGTFIFVCGMLGIFT